MSKARSPRESCSTTIGISPLNLHEASHSEPPQWLVGGSVNPPYPRPLDLHHLASSDRRRRRSSLFDQEAKVKAEGAKWRSRIVPVAPSTASIASSGTTSSRFQSQPRRTTISS